MPPYASAEDRGVSPSNEETTDMRVVSDLDSQLLDDVAWDSFVASSPHGHLLQSSLWGKLKARFGWSVERVAILHKNAIIAGAQILFRPLSLGLTLAYIPKGPLVDWDDEKTTSLLLTAARQAAQRRRAFCLKLEPDLPDDSNLSTRLELCGLRSSPQIIQPRSTIIIELDCEEKEILARAKPKTRYNINLAARKGVIVRAGTAADLPAFHRLLAETARRNAFTVHDAQYYSAAYDLFISSEHGRLLLATYHDAVLAGIMVFVFGQKAWYMYGASSNEHRNRMPNYILQWEAIRWARDMGCLTYDLWGIPDEAGKHLERYAEPATKRRDGLWGVYRFKRGFGGRIVRYIGAYDDVYHRPAYWLYKQAVPLLEREWGETWHRRLRSG